MHVVSLLGGVAMISIPRPRAVMSAGIAAATTLTGFCIAAFIAAGGQSTGRLGSMMIAGVAVTLLNAHSAYAFDSTSKRLVSAELRRFVIVGDGVLNAILAFLVFAVGFSTGLSLFNNTMLAIVMGAIDAVVLNYRYRPPLSLPTWHPER